MTHVQQADTSAQPRSFRWLFPLDLFNEDGFYNHKIPAWRSQLRLRAYYETGLFWDVSREID